jgi:putative ATP-dependent endonuclease of OLD family
MRLAHVGIRNFRSIKELELDLAQVCALVGPNNAGKSNFLVGISRVPERGRCALVLYVTGM